MAKLSVLAAALLLVALVALSQVSAFRTTVTTTVFEDGEAINRSSRQEQCREKMKLSPPQLSHCEMYLSRSFRDPQEEHLPKCCDQLKKIDSQCMCDAIEMMMEQQSQPMGEEMVELAKRLPESCNIGSSSPCKFRRLGL